jgi:hypothetical protein
MMLGPDDASWDDVVDMMGTPIACSRCNAREELTIVAFLTEVDGRPALSAAERFNPEDKDWSHIEMPTMDPPSLTKPVDLWCHRCDQSCGSWTTRAVMRRVARGKPWVPKT